MQKTVNVETKVDLRFSIMIRDFNIYYPRNYRSSNFTSTALKVLIQETIAKKSYLIESSPKKIKLVDEKGPASLQTHMAKSLEQRKKNRKD